MYLWICTRPAFKLKFQKLETKRNCNTLQHYHTCQKCLTSLPNKPTRWWAPTFWPTWDQAHNCPVWWLALIIDQVGQVVPQGLSASTNKHGILVFHLLAWISSSSQRQNSTLGSIIFRKSIPQISRIWNWDFHPLKSMIWPCRQCSLFLIRVLDLGR